jgi:hypothetical protein
VVDGPSALAYAPAGAVEVKLAALRYELEVLEEAVRRAEAEADELERLAVDAFDDEDQAVLVSVSRFLEQHGTDAGARRRALLDDGQVLADRRLVGAREEIEVILLGADAIDLTDTGHAPAGAPAIDPDDVVDDETDSYFHELLEVMEPYTNQPVIEPPAALVAAPLQPAPPEPLAAMVAVPPPTLLADPPAPESTPAPASEPIEPHVDEADAHFQQFWGPADAARPEGAWPPPAPSVPPALIAGVIAIAVLLLAILLVLL